MFVQADELDLSGVNILKAVKKTLTWPNGKCWSRGGDKSYVMTC